MSNNERSSVDKGTDEKWANGKTKRFVRAKLRQTQISRKSKFIEKDVKNERLQKQNMMNTLDNSKMLHSNEANEKNRPNRKKKNSHKNERNKNVKRKMIISKM